MLKKIFISLIAFGMFIQGGSLYPRNVYATDQVEENTVKNETISVGINGVDGETQGVISIGQIEPLKYEGYTFVNATVNGVVIDYIGIINGQYYYTNTKDQNLGSLLLEDKVIILNYKKILDNFTIDYKYDSNVIVVDGLKEAVENSDVKFRVEFKEGVKNYRITSVVMGKDTLTADSNGYYWIKGIQENKEITINTEMITEYFVTVRKENLANAEYNFPPSAKVGESWIGTISLKRKTLNSIVVNDQYLDIPKGYPNDNRDTILKDGTKINVSVVREYNWGKARYEYYYTITAINIQSNLFFNPAVYLNEYDIAITSLGGAELYHWDGERLIPQKIGNLVYKNNDTDVFFVKTKPGYQPSLVIGGTGSKIIETISEAGEIKKVPGGYSNAKAEAEKIGCGYVFYYSYRGVKNRTVELATELINYQVVYDLNGGNADPAIVDNTKYNIEDKDKNTITISSEIPNRENYTFTGWKLVATNEIYHGNDKIVINEEFANSLKSNEIKLQAQWKVKEDVKTSSYQTEYYFEQESGEFIENIEMRKTFENVPIGETAIFNNPQIIGAYDFDHDNQNNVLTLKIGENSKSNVLKAYYIIAERTMTYDKGSAVSGDVPNDAKSPYHKGDEAIVLENTGNLVGSFETDLDKQFVCWKEAGSNEYYFAGDKVIMNDNLVLQPVFMGDLVKDKTLAFVAGDNGKIEGQDRYAVPASHGFGNVILNSKQLPIPTANAGYSFDGWYIENIKIASDASELYTKVVLLDGSSVIQARFVKDDMKWTTVQFNVGEHGYLNGKKSDITTADVLIGSTFDDQGITIPEITAEDGWMVNGWDVKPENTSIIKKGMVFTAQYVEDRNDDGVDDNEQYVTVTFNAGAYGNYKGEATVKTEKMLPGDVINLPTLTTDTGYLFTGYDSTVLTTIPTDLETKELVYTAQYVEDRNDDGVDDNEQYVTVTFNAGAYGNYNGETTVKTEKMLPGDVINVPTLTTDEGYLFTGYDSTVLTTIPTDLETKELVYTAQYVEDRNDDGVDDNEQYVTVTFNAGTHGNYNGEATVKTEKMLPGDVINVPTLTTDEGYLFIGYDSTVLTTIPTDLETKELVYTAQYVEDRNDDGVDDNEQYVTVTFNAGAYGNYNGEATVKTEKMLPGDVINVPTLTTDEGYLFTGYDSTVLTTIPTDLETKELVYTAQYVEDRNDDGVDDNEQYVTVTFNAGAYGNYNGEATVKTEKMLPGDVINVPTLTTDTGYLFTGYDSTVLTTIPTDLETKELVYTAQYEVVTETTPEPTEPVVPVVPDNPVTPTPPAGPQENIVVAPEPETEEDVITPNDVPLGNPDDVRPNETIEDNEVPLGKLHKEWALLNLVSAVITVIGAVILLLMNKRKDDEQEENEENKPSIMTNVLSVILALASVVLFFVTQDLAAKMTIVDNWTIVMVILLVVQVGLIALKKVRK